MWCDGDANSRVEMMQIRELRCGRASCSCRSHHPHTTQEHTALTYHTTRHTTPHHNRPQHTTTHHTDSSSGPTAHKNASLPEVTQPALDHDLLVLFWLQQQQKDRDHDAKRGLCQRRCDDSLFFCPATLNHEPHTRSGVLPVYTRQRYGEMHQQRLAYGLSV